MSGIEAVFGLAASGAGLVSLGLQLCESAMKLRKIYNTVKEAPITVSSLVISLETMGLALRELERSRQRDNRCDALLERCITTCQQSTAHIGRLVDKMESHLAGHARIRGQLYFAFKERDIKELLDDLEKAKSSLELAYMMYLAEEQRQRDLEQRQRYLEQSGLLNRLNTLVSEESTNMCRQLAALAQSSTIQSQPDPEVSGMSTTRPGDPILGGVGSSTVSNDSKCIVRRHEPPGGARRRRKTEKIIFGASFCLPLWLSHQIWSLSMSRSQSCWGIQLRTYNIVDDDSLIIYHCRNGNLSEVQKLFQTGKATPWDVTRTEQESSLLIVKQSFRIKTEFD